MAGKPRGAPPAPHGTRPRYQQHRREREAPCEPCTRANTEDTARRRAARRAVKLAVKQGPSWWCVIAAADHLEWDGQPPGEVRRELADSASRDPWAGAA
jgi:hypothetical protein